MKLELLRLCHAVSVHVSALFPLAGLSSAGLKFFIQKYLIKEVFGELRFNSNLNNMINSNSIDTQCTGNYTSAYLKF